MSAPKVGQQSDNGVQKASKTQRNGGQVAQADVRDQADSGNERGNTSLFSYSECPLHAETLCAPTQLGGFGT